MSAAADSFITHTRHTDAIIKYRVHAIMHDSQKCRLPAVIGRFRHRRHNTRCEPANITGYEMTRDSR